MTWDEIGDCEVMDINMNETQANEAAERGEAQRLETALLHCQGMIEPASDDVHAQLEALKLDAALLAEAYERAHATLDEILEMIPKVQAHAAELIEVNPGPFGVGWRGATNTALAALVCVLKGAPLPL